MVHPNESPGACLKSLRSRAAMGAIRVLKSIGCADLLILDELGLEPLDAGARHDLVEILEERYGRRSTIVTSQLDAQRRALKAAAAKPCGASPPETEPEL